MPNNLLSTCANFCLSILCTFYPAIDFVLIIGYWVMTVIMAITAKFCINLSFTGVWVWSNELFPTVVRLVLLFITRFFELLIPYGMI